MKEFLKGVGIFLTIITILLFIGYGMGWFSVFSTKTLGKAKQNAETEVYYETQAFISGKRQAALKYYKEYQDADLRDKPILRNLIANEFADFDESHLNAKLADFISYCKYGN